MRFVRFFLVALVLLAVSAPSYAICAHCRVNECWLAYGRNSRCYSYGTACLVAGYCEMCGEDPPGFCIEAPFASADRAPLNRDYALASVEVVLPKAPPLTIAEARRN